MTNNNDKDLQWRSVGELAGFEAGTQNESSAASEEAAIRENFPGAIEAVGDLVSRRSFISLMSASLALAGLAGCRRPVEKIIPYVIPPEDVIPGVPQYYATTMPFGLQSFGLIVETHEGRPTKIEGNKNHPSTLGSAGPFILSSILELYDPDRSRKVVNDGSESDWSRFESYWKSLFDEYRKKGGKGLAVVSSSFNSPTLHRLRRQFLDSFPESQWIAYEPVSDENILLGIEGATRRTLLPEYRFDRARIILSLDCDFLNSETGALKNAFNFALSRNPSIDSDSMSRLYCVEGNFSLTGAMADHRLALPPSATGDFLLALIAELKRIGIAFPFPIPASGGIVEPDKRYVEAVAADLVANRNHDIICAGRSQPPWVHALVCTLNSILNPESEMVRYNGLPFALTSDTAALKSLVQQMKSGLISTLVMFDINLAYCAPTDINFTDALAGVRHKIHFGTYYDETAAVANWHLPAAHYLESWGDCVSVEGVRSVVQPLIEPLYAGKPAVEIAHLLAAGQSASGHEIVRRTWQEIIKDSFEYNWQKVLHDGYYSEPEPAAIRPELAELADYLAANLPSSAPGERRGLELAFIPSPSTYDGRYANLSWLQELPDPVTKITWDNPARIGYSLARNLDLQNGDMIAVNNQGTTLELPVLVTPGIADGLVVVELGYGRTAAGRVGNGVGFNTFRLRRSDSPNFTGGVAVARTGGKYKLAGTQEHHTMEGRPLIRRADLNYFRSHPEFASEMVEHPPLKSLWKEPPLTGQHQWGMTIDLNSCIGCGACTIACQSENNIPVVGKEGVARGREMHWIRVDRYFSGPADSPDMLFMPVPCQHCENAPCEQVCPVQATVHDHEGLNAMVYNRCVGTRYCSNNCPYKVRRFNFFNYTKSMPETLKMLQNPDVTVRSRGVMEKCTYCIQRINRAKISAKIENRQVADGEILTACQQACPTNAIVFGDIAVPRSRVTKMKADSRNYELLAELNNKPRTSYLARIRNPNPALVDNDGAMQPHNPKMRKIG